MAHVLALAIVFRWPVALPQGVPHRVGCTPPTSDTQKVPLQHALRPALSIGVPHEMGCSAVPERRNTGVGRLQDEACEWLRRPHVARVLAAMCFSTLGSHKVGVQSPNREPAQGGWPYTAR